MSANQVLYAWLSVPAPAGATLFWLTALAEWPVYGLPVLLAGLWLFGTRDDRERAVAAGLAGGLALFLAHLASTLIDHPRPFMVGLAANVLDHPADSSFPSDHATLFFALAAGFAFRPSPRWRRLGIALAVAGLAVGWARVALGVHFPLDVVGAALIGGAAAFVVRMPLLRRPLAVLDGIVEGIRQRLPWRSGHDGRRASPVAGDDARPAH